MTDTSNTIKHVASALARQTLQNINLTRKMTHYTRKKINYNRKITNLTFGVQ